MRIVTAQELESWLETGRVLEKDGRGPKVVALENGLFLKIFHTRRHPLLARLQPAARRFANNANSLQRLGIAVPSIEDIFWLDKKNGVSGCLYVPLPGQSIEQIYIDTPEKAELLLAPLARFIYRLHKHGIYFRSLHLGNILQLTDGEYGLIDILDLQLKSKPLSYWQVKRNFRHLERYLKRKNLTFPLTKLISAYQQQ